MMLKIAEIQMIRIPKGKRVLLQIKANNACPAIYSFKSFLYFLLCIFAAMPQVLSKDFLIKCAQEFGTPLYVYHAERIKEQYDQLKNAFANCDARFFYACKALTNINILKYIKSIGCGVDCSSINEVL